MGIQCNVSSALTLLIRVCINAAVPYVCVPNSASLHVYISLAFAVKAQLRKHLSVHLSGEIWSLNCKYSFPFETCSSSGSCRFLWFHTFRAKRWWCVYNSFITADLCCPLKQRQPEQQCSASVIAAVWCSLINYVNEQHSSKEKEKRNEVENCFSLF